MELSERGGIRCGLICVQSELSHATNWVCPSSGCEAQQRRCRREIASDLYTQQCFPFVLRVLCVLLVDQRSDRSRRVRAKFANVTRSAVYLINIMHVIPEWNAHSSARALLFPVVQINGVRTTERTGENGSRLARTHTFMDMNARKAHTLSNAHMFTHSVINVMIVARSTNERARTHTKYSELRANGGDGAGVRRRTKCINCVCMWRTKSSPRMMMCKRCVCVRVRLCTVSRATVECDRER